MKFLIKNVIAHTLYYSGLLHLYKRLRMRDSTVVLMYHRVLKAEERRESFSHEAIIVDDRIFARQVAFLKRAFKLLSLEEFCRHLQEKRPLPSGSCLITFDDGWRDNYDNAFPILKQHQAPAAIFLPVSYIGTGELFWQERLGRMLHWLHRERDHYPASLLEKHGIAELAGEPESAVRQRIKRLVNSHKGRPPAELEALLSELDQAVRAQLHDNVDAFMDWQQIKTMAQNGVAFGSHSVSHRILTHISPDEARTELAQSQARLEAAFAAPVRTVAYPNGDVDSLVAQTAGDCGYQVGFTTRRGWVTVSDDPLMLNRINIHDGSTRNIPMFYCRVLGLF